MDGAYEACSGVVLASHPPQFLALGEGHFLPEMTTGNGAFDLELSGHFPNITTAAQIGVRTGGRPASATFATKVIRPSHVFAEPVTQPKVGPTRPAWL